MAQIQLANFADSTLAVAVAPGDTTLTFAGTSPTTTFPTITGSDWFYAVLVDTSANREIVKVTAHAAGTRIMTIVREQEGTLTGGITYGIGSLVSLRLTVQSFADVVAALGVSTSGANMTGGVNWALTTVASHATTADIFATTVGNLIDWTGTANTTDFTAAPQAGAERTLVCAGAAEFTAGANMLIDGLASGQKYTAVAGDKILVRAVTTTQFRLTVFPYAGVSRFVQAVEASYATTSSTSSAILFDNSIPQIGEGTELVTVTITPRSTTNRLRLEASLPMVDGSGLIACIAAIFQKTPAVNDALSTAVCLFPATDYTTNMSFTHEMVAPTTSAVTFSLRAGPAAGTMYFNRRAGGSTLGGATAIRLRVTEIAV